MTILSILRRTLYNGTTGIRKMSDHRTMLIIPSDWSWIKFKDMLHFYSLVAAIPFTAAVFFSSLYIGPGRLQAIPDGYHPQEHEYEHHPITRTMVKYCLRTYQEDYERKMYVMYYEDNRRQKGLVEQRVKDIIAETGDSKAFYYRGSDRELYDNLQEAKELDRNRVGEI